MILYIENSQIGNKLFQYIGLKKYFPKEKLIFLGRDDHRQIFDNINFNFINMKKIHFLFFYYLKYFILFLIKIRFLGVINETASSKNYKINVKKGLFWWILVSHNNFFQHKDIIKEIENFPVLKKKIIKKGLIWLKKRGVDLKKKKIVFIHIRRGDYLKWPSENFPAALNLDWYYEKMKLMKKKLKDSIFIIMSDDYQYIRKSFVESESLLISNNQREIDLSIMSLCNAGILSASTYAWWGAFYAKKKNNNAYFVGPKYWAGYRKKKWLPKYFFSSWIKYVK
jgi:hypothetical protein